MALGIYSDNTPGSQLSEEGALTAPLSITLDGKSGGTEEVKLYLRNDDNNFDYSNITVKPVQSSGVSVIDGTNGFYWKLSEGDDQPSSDEWDDISEANTINFSDVTDTTTYQPFWVKIKVPRNSSIKTLTSVSLEISYTETAS